MCIKNSQGDIIFECYLPNSMPHTLFNPSYVLRDSISQSSVLCHTTPWYFVLILCGSIKYHSTISTCMYAMWQWVKLRFSKPYYIVSTVFHPAVWCLSIRPRVWSSCHVISTGVCGKCSIFSEAMNQWHLHNIFVLVHAHINKYLCFRIIFLKRLEIDFLSWLKKGIFSITKYFYFSLPVWGSIDVN